MNHKEGNALHVGEGMTIIVPVYNRSGLVLRTLDSIKSQTYRPIRLIVVDNNSTDMTPEVIASWKKANEEERFRVDIFTEPGRGASKARQLGFEKSEGEYVMFFDSDDTMDSNLVELAMKAFRKHPDRDMVTWRVRLHDLNRKVSVTHGSGTRPVFIHLVHSLLRTQGYAVRREIIEKSGGWNKDLSGWDDWELGVRILLLHPRMVHISEIPVDVYCREDSITGKDFSSKEGEWEKALDSAEAAIKASGFEKKEGLLRWISYRRVILAAQYNREGNHYAVNSLLEKVLSDPNLSKRRRLFMRLVFHYTSRGGRGIAMPARFIL